MRFAYEYLVAEHDVVEHARSSILQQIHCSDSEPVGGIPLGCARLCGECAAEHQREQAERHPACAPKS